MTKNLSQWLEYIAGIHVSAIDMGLERVLPVAQKLDILPQAWQDDKPYVFTVAGTNGKGSTTATISQICQSAGHKVALYQSPHLVDFAERVKIDNQSVSEKQLIDAFEKVESARLELGLSLSFFEMTTLAAFLIFKEANADIWVLEIGLGGRLDVVNIIEPNVAVITNIGIDHVDWLGDDIEKIGAEKAGIIRPNIPVILGEYSMPNSVQQIASEQQANVLQIGKSYDFQELSDAWIYSSSAITMRLPKPNLSIKNAANAVSAVLASDIKIDQAAIEQGLAQVQLAGRFDRRKLHARNWIFDVAHNEAGIAFLLEQLTPYWQDYQQQNPNAKLHILFSMLGDKDVGAVLKQVKTAIDKQKLPVCDWHVAAIDHFRAMNLPDLLNHTYQYIDKNQVIAYDSLAQATRGVITSSQEQDLIVAFGSFHTIAESLIYLTNYQFKK